jgi:sulfite exporter TauE/SafE
MMVVDLLLVMALGFLGSFGHCVGMCGPLTVAFSLAHPPAVVSSWQRQLTFHGLLNLGRLVSYVAVGTAIGGLGSVLLAGGEVAGLDSSLRRAIALVTGMLLVWLGLVQIQPEGLPKLPLIHSWLGQGLHSRLSRAMTQFSSSPRWWTPALLGMVWGLMPCGFLYTAQIKAAETANPWLGGLTLLAFGLGTLPAMLGIGVSASRLSADQRSQFFQIGGWVTLAIGISTLVRTGNMVDYSGYGSLGLLVLVLIARPISRLWTFPLRYRRVLGVGAFVLALAHMGQMLAMGWNLQAIPFMLPTQSIGTWSGLLAIALMIPLALTSFDALQARLGDRWRQLHLLILPAYSLVVVHVIFLGSHYLGGFEPTWLNHLFVVGLIVISGLVFLVRWRKFWALLSLGKLYG